MSERSPFNPALIIGLIVAALVSFAGFLMLLAWGGDGGVRNAGRATALSTSAIGYKALVDLADRYYDTELLRDETLLDADDLVVVALEPGHTRAQVQTLLRRRADQPTVLILPKWASQPDPEQRRWVRSTGPLNERRVGQLLGEEVDVEPLSANQRARRNIWSYGELSGISVTLPQSAQVIHGEDTEMLIGIPGEGALVARLGDAPHYVIADPDLVNNHGLRDPRTARAAVQMLAQLRTDADGAIRFDLTVNGAGGGRSILRSMFEPPFLAMTLALVAAALLAGLHGAVRFGPTRRPVRAIPFGKAALVENSAGLIRLARREVRLGGGYAAVIRDDAGRAAAAPATLRDGDLEAYLDRFTRPGETPFSTLAAALRSAGERSELIGAARALFRWKKDMIR